MPSSREIDVWVTPEKVSDITVAASAPDFPKAGPHAEWYAGSQVVWVYHQQHSHLRVRRDHMGKKSGTGKLGSFLEQLSCLLQTLPGICL